MKQRIDNRQLHDSPAAPSRSVGFVRPCVARGENTTRDQGSFSPVEFVKQ